MRLCLHPVHVGICIILVSFYHNMNLHQNIVECARPLSQAFDINSRWCGKVSSNYYFFFYCDPPLMKHWSKYSSITVMSSTGVKLTSRHVLFRINCVLTVFLQVIRKACMATYKRSNGLKSFHNGMRNRLDYNWVFTVIWVLQAVRQVLEPLLLPWQHTFLPILLWSWINPQLRL